ncbi:septation protein SepH [Pseudarthrobacter sp. TAF60_1]|uniref:septation protein SepH n=1 Tax=Pseudarthrobacter sp. TAF60_1 TaxID=3233071 RepID=UPI003F9BBC2F
MQDLRLVGVHDDGEHLLLSGAGGEMFQLPIDEALRAASRSSAKAATAAAPIAMSPRDIQARIRSGATAADVAELSGLPLAKVERYEGPVLAEREYVAQQARKVEVASPSPGHDAYRSIFGDNPATLGDMVNHRLSAHGIEPSTVEWDSWRRQDGNWTVAARFEPQREGPAGIGEEPPALWTFSPGRKSLHNANRWAQQLSELEPLDGPVPARRLTAVSDRPFDFETDAEAAARNATGPLPVLQAKESDGLLDMLRSRRGQRLGVDEDADDALALLLTHGVPAAHPRPSEVVPEQGASQGPEQNNQDEPPAEAIGPDSSAPAAHLDPLARRRDGRPSMMSRLSIIPPHRDDGEDDVLKLHDGVSTETREITIVASPLRPAGPGAPAEGPEEPGPPAPSAGLDELLGGSPRRAAYAAGSDEPAPGRNHDADLPERQPAKPKRSTVPSWDEIVFGTKRD